MFELSLEPTKLQVGVDFLLEFRVAFARARFRRNRNVERVASLRKSALSGAAGESSGLPYCAWSATAMCGCGASARSATVTPST